jgi:hypothetical protein
VRTFAVVDRRRENSRLVRTRFDGVFQVKNHSVQNNGLALFVVAYHTIGCQLPLKVFFPGPREWGQTK